ncbi:hypothetical protein OTU49_017170 [Cherax quadricarinatus]|uniref:Uncharacterized protein n=1 Tax=Cherax quadricarinatus TaxID=27406 RepID=A0AAW0Y3U6_CHEQU
MTGFSLEGLPSDESRSAQAMGPTLRSSSAPTAGNFDSCQDGGSSSANRMMDGKVPLPCTVRDVGPISAWCVSRYFPRRITLSSISGLILGKGPSAAHTVIFEGPRNLQ